MAEVVILGAGLTGLSAAYHLECYDYLDYEIFEQDERPGGLLKTVKVDDFNFDYTGHLLHVSDQQFYKFLDEIIGIGQNLNLNKRYSAILYKDKVVDYPFQVNLHELPIDVVYECLQGYIDRKKDLRRPRNFYEWVLKHFGAGLGRHFFFPYNSKQLDYNLKNISSSWTGRFVPQTNLKLILQGALKRQLNQSIGYNDIFYYPKSGGIETLIQSIQKKLIKKIKTGHKAVFIDIKNKSVLFENGHVERYRKLITTIPLKNLLASTSNFRYLSDRLLCNSVINFNLGFNAQNNWPWHWLYFPEKHYPFYRVGFWHNISQLSTKSGCTGIYGETSYLQGTKSQRQIESLITKSTVKALDFLGLTKDNVLVQNNLNIEYAYVIYDWWREKNLSKILNLLIDQSVYSIGRFGGWNYSSMQEAMLDGKRVAKSILSEFKLFYFTKFDQQKRVVP